MTGAKWAPVILPNGVARNPLGSEDDPLEKQVFDAVLDLMLCLRGATANRDLGFADRYMVVGEPELAFEEVRASIGNAETLDEWSSAALARASTFFDGVEA